MTALIIRAVPLRRCFLILGVATMVACMRDLGGQQGQQVDITEDSPIGSRVLLSSTLDSVSGEVVIAQGRMGSLVQMDLNEVDSEYHRQRALLGKGDDDDDDDDEEEDRLEVSAMVGVQVKQFRTPASWRKSKKKKRRQSNDDEEEEDEDDDRKKKKKKKAKKNSKLERDDDGNVIIVDTPVSPRFGDYVKKEPDFLDRIAYLGTTKRSELNAICKKVAKGKTKFKADVNIDQVDGAPDTGDDIEDAKVDHQFGCTITKGPKVKLNPNLKKGVVFALLELQGVNNLIDCQKGVKKCNIWELLDDEDAEDLMEEFAKEKERGRGGRRLLVKPTGGDTAVRSGILIGASPKREEKAERMAAIKQEEGERTNPISPLNRCMKTIKDIRNGNSKDFYVDIGNAAVIDRILKECVRYLTEVNPDASDDELFTRVGKIIRGDNQVNSWASIMPGGEEEKKPKKPKGGGKK